MKQQQIAYTSHACNQNLEIRRRKPRDVSLSLSVKARQSSHQITTDPVDIRDDNLSSTHAVSTVRLNKSIYMIHPSPVVVSVFTSATLSFLTISTIIVSLARTHEFVIIKMDHKSDVYGDERVIKVITGQIARCLRVRCQLSRLEGLTRSNIRTPVTFILFHFKSKFLSYRTTRFTL